jgi:exosortase family protein XrtF
MNSNKALYLFLIKCLGLYFIWFLLYEGWLKGEGQLDFWLTNLVSSNSVFLLKTINSDYTHLILFNKHFIYWGARKILAIANPCNGLVLYPLFWGFILATPGEWKKKLMMIFIGSIFIYSVNVLRVISLVNIKLYYPNYLDFNHKYTFSLLMYGIIFGLWMIWINLLSKKNIKHNEELQ